MQKESKRFVDSCVFEGMTSIRTLIRAYDSGINDRKIKSILYDKTKMQKISKEIGYFKAVSEKYGFGLVESTTEELEKITLGSSHGGIVAIAGERTLPYLNADFLEPCGFYAMIQGIEDPYNFGYALRSLYACGCTGIILPERNWLSAAGVVARSSAGASEMFKIAKSTPQEAVSIFKQCGYTVVCADERTDNVLGKCELKKPLLLIVGGEKRGISRSVIDMADFKVRIDYMRDFNASLSAASATTVFALFLLILEL